MSAHILTYLDSLSAEERGVALLHLMNPPTASVIPAEVPPTPTPASVPASEPAAPKKKKVTKAKPLDDLLVPVDAIPMRPLESVAAGAGAAALPTAPPTAAPTVDPTDPLRGHPSRLQKIDSARCMGRKPALSKHVPGTHKDEGGVKKIHPEGQCSGKPDTGYPLCPTCKTNEANAAAGKRDPKKWFGRLDQPMYEFAAVVGCKQYLDAYPEGIKGDALSVPPKATVTTVTTAAPATAATAAPVAPEKKVTGKKAKATAAEAPVAVANVAVVAVEAIWETFLYRSAPVALHIPTQFVYNANPRETDRSKIALMDQPIGRLRDATEEEAAAAGVVLVKGTKLIDAYDLPDEE